MSTPPPRDDTTPEAPQTEREEYLSDVRRRIETVERCAEALVAVTTSLEELSAKIELMKTSTQQLNAFTSGWLTVWKRPE
ncbi:hypothetical protein P43SY_009452 [Pythium insidiosum]|uniref:Uncharacterized protein n=1 Tax=Pythium insidiosum TaxID=114742 RepID=A0AAD5LNE1_PYTIN|nr:hypothetical protein P43SY_009452 [Pythium insidiosum]KAJ0408474.1 hypothetical protein ATCC90586_008412 [Pythium insidiosum]